MAAGDGGNLGNGVRIGWRTATSPLAAWNRIGQLMDVTGFGLDADAWDSDVHSDVRYKRQAPGKINVAPLELKILANLNPASGEGAIQQDLFELLESGETVTWRVERPTNRTNTSFHGTVFDGWIKAFTSEQPRTDGQMLNVTVVYDSTTFTRDAAAGASEM